jgi:hypothetical protein
MQNTHIKNTGTYRARHLTQRPARQGHLAHKILEIIQCRLKAQQGSGSYRIRENSSLHSNITLQL